MAKNKKKTIKKTVTTITEETVNTNEKTHLICILDRSYSMIDIIDTAISGFNEFLNKQQLLPDEATITVALFDDDYELLYDNVDIKEAEKLTREIWSPRGMTALYDAIGKTVSTEKERFKKLGDEKPDKVLVCIVTDGLENRSVEYNQKHITEIIKECEDNDWNFIYLAANQDAFDVGQSIGISGNNTYTFDATHDGVMQMANTVSYAATNYRGMSTKSASFIKDSKSLIDNDVDTNE